MFDAATQDALKYYVYCLVDPRNGGEFFYVGKGQKNRVFDHKAQPSVDDEDVNAVSARIADIENAGLSVNRYILCHGLDSEEAAFTVESCVIALLQSGLLKGADLTNQIRGHGYEVNGVMSVNAIQTMYGLPVLQQVDFKHPIMTVNISRSYAITKCIYEAARGDWLASEAKLKQWEGKHYVIAERDGVFVDVFKPKTWETLGNGSKRMRFDNEDGFTEGNQERDELFRQYCKKRNGFHKPGDASSFHYFNM
ncbi:MAG: hypothetical protein LBD04_07920 [Synergistaceae bacterium]|jgi:hypothetical protein|nr:hypothetical protein [Synergistaceae bacterium]